MSLQKVRENHQKELGEEFRERRQEMNLSLKEIEIATSIRMNLLEGIEQGNIQNMISQVYARGFIEQYATFLGLESDDYRKKLASLFPRQDQQEFTYGIGSVEMRGSPVHGGVKWMPGIIWTVTFIVLFGAAWMLAKSLGLL